MAFSTMIFCEKGSYRKVAGISMLLISILIFCCFEKLNYNRTGFMRGIWRKENIRDRIQEKEQFGHSSNYVTERPGPQVELITYLTQGQRPLWNVTKDDKVVYLPAPHKDSNNITNFKRKDLMKIRSDLQYVLSHLPKQFSPKTITYIKPHLANFRADIQDKLGYFFNITRNVPYDGVPISFVISHLDKLLKKKDPKQSWTLTCDRCFKNEFKTILEPRQVCSGDDAIDIIVIVTSVPRSVNSRKAVRETWGSWTKNNTSNFRLVFLFGVGWPESENQILAKESLQYGDILQEDYHDSYYNLTQKVISGFKWVMRACPRAKFVMRSAEDTFVFLPEVLWLLQLHGNHSRFQDYQIGQCLILKPYRFPDFKSYLSKDDYGDHIFPPYALGTTFITSMKLTEKIVKKSVNVTYVPIEDSYFGLVLREIGSGCQNVHPFTPAHNDITNKQKYETFHLVNH